MEYIISLYDKTMFSRWENVKNTTKSDVLEGMLSDIKGKQFALENLSMLVTRKLDHLRIYVPLTSSTEKNSPRKEKSIIPLPFPSFSVTPNNELSKISLRVPPPPPPLPSPPSMSITSSLPQPLPTSISLISQHGKKAQRLSVQKRRRSERREENGEHSHTAVNINEILLTPLSSSGLSHHTVFDTNNNSNSGMASQNNIASTRGFIR
ncbi:uncharacterized protein LOC105697964 [Orussus abietinus]|uniref:uncharacterized protein LOC105697964 n=1 Tax=Orussus abietinus TaxID=222816 RepID=UPI000C715F2E|nr:uncharacterized protein LOC105697964 [Orussus abietinus]